MNLPFKNFAKDMKTASGSIFLITLMEKDLESLPMRTQNPGPTLKKGPVREDLLTRYLVRFDVINQISKKVLSSWACCFCFLSTQELKWVLGTVDETFILGRGGGEWLGGRGELAMRKPSNQEIVDGRLVTSG